MNAIRTTIQDQQKIQIAFWALAGMIIVSAVTYGLMINKTVYNIVASQNAQTTISKLTSDIGQLQSENIALTSQITPEFAAGLGFIHDTSPQYVSYLSTGSSLSFNTVH